MSGESKIVERLKKDVLGELHLMTPADLQAYWKQVKWPKPDLVALAKSESSPLACALKRLPPEILTQASAQLDPFGWLLAAVDVTEWSEYCRTNHEPWMTRVWLAAASQLRAHYRLVYKAHGWAQTWEKLRQSQNKPNTRRDADEFYFAKLTHAKEKIRTEMLALPGLEDRLAKARQEKDEAWLRRFRRAKQGAGQRAGVDKAEKFAVQHWIELPGGLPGLCFFSDVAFHTLLEVFKLPIHKDWATKQLRVRLGLMQAGAKCHLIEDVIGIGNKLSFTGSILHKPWTLGPANVFSWDHRQLWPPRG